MHSITPKTSLRALAFALLLALLLAAFRAYYGTALPLPFYAKTAGLSAFEVG